ncbi:MAG: hypothetical protein ACKVU2_16270, partial [Saprospiraceae bacterium]
MITKFTQSISAGASLFVTKWIIALAIPLLVAQTVQAQLPYQATVCNDPYVQAFGQTGTTFLGQGDDVIFANIALPFPFQLYTTVHTTVNIGTNGFILLNPGTNRGLGNVNLPTAIAGACLYPFWDDLDINQATTPNAGVYTRTDGTAPNRIFTVEWFNAGHFPDVANQVITFQVRLFENGNRVQYKYFDTVFGGTQAAFDNGASATVGLEGPLPAPRPFTLIGFNTQSVMGGQCREFVQPAACNIIPGPTLNLNTSMGLCAASANITLPTFNPVGCANGTTTGLRYSVNGGAFTNVALPATSVTINLPKGANVITWQTYIIANGATAGQATQIVNVVDNEAPIMACPPSIIVNLGPGECCRNVTWPLPTVTDNCPFIVGPFTLNTINLGGNFGNVGGTLYFDFNNISGQNVIITSLGMRITAATNVNVFIKSGTSNGFQANMAAWTLAGVANANTGPFSGPFPGAPVITPAPLNTPITLPPGITGIALVTPTASQIYTNGNGANQTFTDGRITLNLGTATNVPFTAPVFNPRVWNGSVSYQIGGDPQIVQTTGPANGSEFCKENSPYTISYQVADAAGNTATCSFKITINSYPNPVNSLVCNNLTQVSLDPNCSAYVNADQVLEGGPYKCYDDYVVEVDKTLPFGNGPWIRVSKGPAFPGFGAPTPLGPGDVGKTYQVKVSDPLTGNHCWGNLLVEDKFAPVLDCDPTYVACNASSFEPCVDPITILPTAPVQLPPSFVAHGGGTAFSLAGNTQPGGYYLNLTNNDNLPLTVTGFGIRWGNPQFGQVNPPQTVDIFARPTTYVGFETNAAAWTNLGPVVYTVMPPYFATGTGPLSNGNLLQKVTIQPGATHAFHIFGRTACPIFNYFNSTGPQTNFPWVMQGGPITLGLFGPLFQAGAMSAPNIQVLFEKQAPPTCLPNGLVLNQTAFQIGQGTYRANAGAGTPVLDACSDVTLTYVDSSVDEPCTSSNSKTITRKWTAKDASGNTSTCNQTVNVLRPTLGDLELPPSYDDLDEPAIPCGGVYPTPDWVTSQGLQGWPLVFGKPVGCDFGWNYNDVRIDVCDGTYKVRRRWTILNWCTGLNTDHDQIIKIKDDVAPTFTCPANITVGTDPFTCCATVDLPDFIVTDNCSRIKKVSAMVITFDPQTNQQTGMQVVAGGASDFPGNNYWDRDTMAVLGSTTCLPIGTHRVIYQVEDDCGNT